MAIVVRCRCGRVLKARDEFGGSRAVCPTCGGVVELPAASPGADTVVDLLEDEAAPVAVTEFLDPPGGAEPPAAEEAEGGGEERAASSGDIPVLRRMFEALLDPRSIQWMLVIGGALCVLGIIVWLVSKGVFADKRVMAATLGAGTLAILGSGWFVALRTRYRLAGQALTFLGCVVAPLNLWFYHAQGMLTVDGHLWVGGVVCCLIYAATVSILRDPLFMFACEAGVTLTAILLLGDLGKITDATWLSLFLMALGMISIHAERAFSPAAASAFPRKRYGLPLFWSGHVQLGGSLVILLGSQLMAWLVAPVRDLFGIEWPGNPFAQHHLLAAGMWLAAAYAYLYSDVVVRRVGGYLALAAASLVMAEATLLLGFDVDAEWIIAAMAVTAVGINWAQVRWTGAYRNLDRVAAPLALVLSLIPVAWGLVMHVRATSPALRGLSDAPFETGQAFVAVMLVTAIANRVSAYLTRRSQPQGAWVYFFLSATALMTAATALLRQIGFAAWSQQAPWLMLIPLGYMLASRMHRGHTAERPFYWVAQAAAGVVLVQTLSGAMRELHSLAPGHGVRETLMLGFIFAEAAGFYILGATFHRRSLNVHLAAAAACGALWQLMGYFGVDSSYYTMLYAGLGVACLAGGRLAGLTPTGVYRLGEGNATVLRGRGLAAFQCGTGILCIALLAAFMQGLTGLAAPPRDGRWFDLGSLAATIAAGLAAALVPAANWRRFYTVAAAALTGVLALRANMMVDLHMWEKLELVAAAAGALMLVASHVARFRESEGRREEAVSMGLAAGSLLAATPLLIAVLYHRWVGGHASLWNEILLLTVTIAMSVTGAAWQIKWTTLWGGAALVLYLVVLVCSLAYTPQVEIGVYLAVGGAAVFAAGIALSVYRERLLELPERVANREGVFRILNWR